MQGVNKAVAIVGAFLLALAAYAYGWYRGDLGKQPDLVPAATAEEEDRKTYYPNTEELGPNEMRVISLGTGMPNQRKSQASACWLVELGNGDKFIFDLGTGSVANLSVLEIPYDLVNKVFVGHLHSDHIGDFAAWHIG
ncbi:MAG: MBL fold metallo-hydrolase, partial [Myxococcales bacterium]|nr:MBL fold metallo-hydrolase [Myxococcales bacterium]